MKVLRPIPGRDKTFEICGCTLRFWPVPIWPHKFVTSVPNLYDVKTNKQRYDSQRFETRTENKIRHNGTCSRRCICSGSRQNARPGGWNSSSIIWINHRSNRRCLTYLSAPATRAPSFVVVPNYRVAGLHVVLFTYIVIKNLARF